MALRNIREIGDDILYKKAKEVKEITEKTRELIDDMLETMYEADGVGLAAPQVGDRMWCVCVPSMKRCRNSRSKEKNCWPGR